VEQAVNAIIMKGMPYLNSQLNSFVAIMLSNIIFGM
jgi:hypothetical protein